MAKVGGHDPQFEKPLLKGQNLHARPANNAIFLLQFFQFL